jgi:alpha-beta hydrolase superfamily lysophospholipase
MSEIFPFAYTNEGAVLRGALHLPEGPVPDGGFPVVLLAHGLGALQQWSHRTAAVFTAAGLAALTVDYRGFGHSDGEPRQQADPWRIVHDLRAALDNVVLDERIDGSRIGVWGTSFGGGLATVAAAVDRRVKVLFLQVPVASGGGLMKAITPPEVLEALGNALDADRVGIAAGKPPVRSVQTSTDPAAGALASDEGTYSWMTEEAAATTPHWINELTFQTIDRLLEFEPGDYLPRFAPRPVLLAVVEGDEINPEQYSIDALDKTDAPKKLLRLVGGGHYSVYREHFDAVSSAARDWFAEHLLSGDAP